MKLRTSNPKAFVRATAAVFLLSFILFSVGLYFAWQSHTWISHSQSATGTVLQLNQRAGTDGSTFYTPVIRFQPSTGPAITFTADIATDPAPFALNEKVPILYDPLDPYDAKINSFLYLWFTQFFLAFPGIAGILASLAFWAIFLRPLPPSTLRYNPPPPLN